MAKKFDAAICDGDRYQRVAAPFGLKDLLAPFPSDEMTCWPVSARVGNVKNNDSSLIEPIAA